MKAIITPAIISREKMEIVTQFCPAWRHSIRDVFDEKAKCGKGGGEGGRKKGRT